MSQIYTYPISSFPNGVNLDKLTNTIKADVAITETLLDISYVSSDVNINFNNPLSSEEKAELDNIVATHDGTPPIYPPTDLRYYLDFEVPTTDSRTSITGPFYMMQPLINRREIFNDSNSPLYIAGFTPLIGANGSVTNLNNIHAKIGWHNQMIVQARFSRPKDILIYYGWLNSFNSATNGWFNEKVAQDMAKYQIIIFGDGIENPSHGDYANTQIIIPRIKQLNTSTLIFGYVSTNQSYADFQTKTDQWNTLGVHGIMMDESGYDYGTVPTNGREAFNQKVDYVHGKSSAKICFPNAWDTDHILGTADDISYPNTTWNPSLLQSKLNENDWIMLESYPVNTTSYSGNGGYETAGDWTIRGNKVNYLQSVYGCNFASVNIIDNGDPNGQNLFNFAFVSSMMWSLEAFGTSDTGYGSSSAAVQYWLRPDVTNMGIVYTVNPSVQQDLLDADVYHRFCEFSKLQLDFSTGAQDSLITKF